MQLQYLDAIAKSKSAFFMFIQIVFYQTMVSELSKFAQKPLFHFVCLFGFVFSLKKLPKACPVMPRCGTEAYVIAS